MDPVEDIKARLGIEDVIGEYVQLKRTGRNFKGLSPFGSEKTPSFMVSPEKQIWHDFSSGKGGDMFSFVMEMEGLDFRGALEHLARKAGIDLTEYRGSRGTGNAQQKERLYVALELAAKFYQMQFSKTKAAYEYILGERQFSKATALEWRLGYSPSSGTALLEFLTGKGFTSDELKKAGLITQRYRGAGDMFRGRIMIPLQDPQGRVVGFTARLLQTGGVGGADGRALSSDAPKYINTPQTILYDKSRHVYGLHLAKDAIRKSGYAVLVEGNLDVIASHQAGVRQVVATAGTAMTEANLKTLSRFTDDIRLCFDADKAGIAATERAIPIASKVGVSLSVITIPSGKDPDELIRQDRNNAGKGKQTWQHIINRPQYALDWLMERYGALLDTTTAQGKKEFTNIVLPIIRKLQDSVEQDHYLRELARVLGVSREALDRKLSAQPGRDPVVLRKPASSFSKLPKLDNVSADYRKSQDHMMALLLLHPGLRLQASLTTEQMFTSSQARYIFRYLCKYPHFDYYGRDYVSDGYDGQVASVDKVSNTDSSAPGDNKGDMTGLSVMTKNLHPDQVRSLQDYAKILLLQHEELYGDVEPLELTYEIARIQTRLIEQYIKHEKQNLAAQLSKVAQADEETTRRLLTKAKELDMVLKQAQGGKRG